MTFLLGVCIVYVPLASIKFCILVIVNLVAVVSIDTIRRSSSKYMYIPLSYSRDICVCVCIKYLTRRKQNVRGKPVRSPHKRCHKAFKPTKKTKPHTKNDSIGTKAKYAYAKEMLKATKRNK